MATRALQIVLWSIAVSHIPIGLGLMLSRAVQAELASWYGATGGFTVREVYLVRILGSCILVIGTLAASAARDPARNPVAIVAITEFFLLRNLQRHLYAQELYEGFGVGGAVNVATSVVFFALIAALWMLYNRAAAGRPEDQA